jgi:UDP-N-acetylglucosamine--N-acetylmuramyl-(pentapeptide) pyrophosphoryl-undecaprenol N-acetylglucosamine transferase
VTAAEPGRPLSFLLAGGGTAGHVEPALALADRLRERVPGGAVALLGTSEGLEARLVPARGYPLHFVPRVPLPRRPDRALVSLPVRLRAAVAAAGRVIAETEADVVVGFGGYVSVPAYWAARRAGVPIVVHEANPLPGIANRLGARLTPWVAVSHPDTPLRGARLTGLPLRPAVTSLDRAARRAEARATFGLDPDRPTLLVTGGSQGARRINEAVVAAAPALAAAGVQVLHAAGPKNADAVAAALPADLPTPWRVLSYVDDMPAAYAAADLVICRSGAVTCAELATVGLPAVYVPLPIGNGEQARNAAPVVAAGGGLLVPDAELTGPWIEATVVPLLGDAERMARMAAAARAASPTDAAGALADLVLEAVRRHPVRRLAMGRQ